MGRLNTKRIGLFFTLVSIFGGLFISYLLLSSLILILPYTLEESAIFAFLFLGFVWALLSFWILVSQTKKIVFYKIFGSFLLFLIVIACKEFL